MVLKKLREKIKLEKKIEPSEEWVEISESTVGESRVNVRVETLKDLSDTHRIQQFLREGSVVFLKIKELRAKDISELKRAVERLKKTCLAMNGDMVGVDEDFLILTPNFAKIYRGISA